MIEAAATTEDRTGEGRERRCIVTGDVLPDAKLVRFVADPDGNIVPDLAAKLPGRGIWVTARRDLVARAVAKNLFAKAAKEKVSAAADLPDRVEALLAKRVCDHLGLAKKSGALVSGFDNVTRALESQRPPVLLIEAHEGAADGRRKLQHAAHARGIKPTILSCLTRAELSLALGRENVIHAALLPGGFAERLAFDAQRLEGFRPHGHPKEGAGSNPVKIERHA